MTYAEAMARFGSDKPDLRFGHELVDCTDVLRATPRSGSSRRRTSAPSSCPAAPRQPRRQFDAWQDWAKQRGARGLAYVARRRGRRARRPGRQEPVGRRAGRARPRTSARSRATASSSPPASRRGPRALLGAARLEIGRRCGLIDETAWSFVWVVDAPLFEPADDGARGRRRRRRRGRLDGGPPRLHLAEAGVDRHLRHDPGDALAYAYDIVCNGNEIGGGSIRIHRRDVQERVFAVMGLADGGGAGEVRLPARRLRSTARRRTAASPSAGTGSVALLAGRDSIRDVIAFPKTGGGYDPLTGAPAPITPAQRKEAVKALDKRYGALTLEPRKIKLIDRIVADSRDVALDPHRGPVAAAAGDDEPVLAFRDDGRQKGLSGRLHGDRQQAHMVAAGRPRPGRQADAQSQLRRLLWP